jgi:3-methyladenine DNA glycosylase/8-oxoguanine DNA glycosylase
MVDALVAQLGQRGTHGNAFPTPEAMAERPETFYRDSIRAGFRSKFLRATAARVADGAVSLAALTDRSLSDDAVESQLLQLPGIGPYGAANVMLLLGRYSRFVLDSWTTPTYSRLAGLKTRLSQSHLERRFGHYGRYRGLAFWLYTTRADLSL